MNPNLVEVWKYGAKRRRTITLRKGEKYSSPEGTIVLKVPCLIDITETYKSGDWNSTEWEWDTLREVPPDPPGFFARLWARITRRRLPTARLVKG